MFSILNWRIGFYLAIRQIRRGNVWTTSLIVFVMILTFLNLVVVSGILVGLLQGAIDALRTSYTSDVIISSPNDKEFIENSPDLIALIATLEEVESYTARYMEGGSLEANYQTRRQSDKPNTAGAQLRGIDPLAEDRVTGLSEFIVEGEYLSPGDYDAILLGSYLLEQYIPIDTPTFSTLEDTGVGSKVRVKLGGITREVTVKGILESKVDEISLSAYMVDSQFRGLIGRTDGNVDEISLKLKPGASPEAVRDALLLRGAGIHATVQTYLDAQPQAFRDIIDTFNMLGTAFSSIGLIVASITIFIVVFINAITRRKFIGILKGIGIEGRAIEISYIIQSMFYAVCGSAVGLALVYGLLVPYFRDNPIDFPFSDGILVAPPDETLFRVGLLIVSTIVAGFVPAWIIVRKNTLDSILGRN